MVPVTELEAIKNRIQDELLALPGVTGLMVGEQRAVFDKAWHQNPCLIVMIRQDMKFYDIIFLTLDICTFMEKHDVPLNLFAVNLCSPTTL